MSFYLRASPVSERPRRGRRAGPFPAGRLPPPPKSPGKERLALPFSVGPRQCPGAPTPKFGLRWVVGWSFYGCEPWSSYRLCSCRRRLQEREAEGLRGRLAAGHDPALCSPFQVYLCPFQFSVTPHKGETKQKSLFISFQGL